MNSTTVSAFFSRDVFLKRQARINKRTAQHKLCPSLSNKPLPIIQEEDEPRFSSSQRSRSPSPITQYTPGVTTSGNQTLCVKSKRRHANLSVSDIRIARAALVHDDNDISQQNPALLSSPRPAPRPPQLSTPSPEPSPDPFSLKFTDSSFKFPHPPIPTPSSMFSFEQSRSGSESPTPSMSSSPSTSPESRSTGLPTTPTTSDDELPSSYSSPRPSLKPRRISIKPLVITKINSSTILDESYSPALTTLLQPENSQEQVSPFTPPLSEGNDSPFDGEDSDSEWYNREFSKILTLCSPLPPIFPQQSRPDSVCTPDLPTPPLSPPSLKRPSAQLDPTYPRCRRSRVSIPKYPPPPVPSIPAHLRSSTIFITPPTSPSTIVGSTDRPRSNTLAVSVTPPRRPPPRSSIPADCVFIDETFGFSDDSASAFSFSLYEDSPSTGTPGTDSPTSFYSQASFQSPNPSPFPSSFPSTPSSFPSSTAEEFDFPVDEIEFDLEEANTMMLPLSLPGLPIDLEADIASGLEELRLKNNRQSLNNDEDVFVTGTSSDSSCQSDGTHGLRSRWSSSTLNSVREEHARRSGLGASAKLLSYFGSPSPKSKARGSSASTSRKSGTPSIPMTPTSPGRKFRQARRESDVMAIGYGMQGHGLRRRGSMSSSDAGSEVSSSSSGSSGLRRKPIPVEMFLRSAA